MSDENSDAPAPSHAGLGADTVAALRAAILHRRSMGVARLRPDPVATGLIVSVLEAANWAPSHGETEPWRFAVYTGEIRRALGDAFAEAYRQDAQTSGDFKQAASDAQRDRVFAAPVWISLGVEPALRPDGTPRMTLEEEVMAGACAIQNLHLMASAHGLAGMWLSKGVFRHSHVAQSVGLAPHGLLLGFFVLGWPAIAWPTGARGPLSAKVRWMNDADAPPVADYSAT